MGKLLKALGLETTGKSTKQMVAAAGGGSGHPPTPPAGASSGPRTGGSSGPRNPGAPGAPGGPRGPGGPSVPASGGGPLPPPPAPQNTPGQAVHDAILDFDREVKALKDEHALLERQVQQLRTRWNDIQSQAMRGKVGTHIYVTENEKFDKGMAELGARRQALSQEAQVMTARGEALAVRLTDVGADEMKVAFRTANPREVLDIARRGVPNIRATPNRPPGSPGFASLEMMASIAVTLAMAYFIAQDVKYVLASDSVLQGVGRAAEVGGKYAAGAAEMALFQAVTKSTPVTAVLAMVVGMCGDQAGACEAQERAKREEEEKKAMREDERKLRLAVGNFLSEQAPGSVTWLEDHWQVNDQKLWDRTYQQVQRMRVDHYIKEQMAAKIKAHDLGLWDGRLRDTHVRVDEMKDWDVVDHAPSPDQKFLELFEEYKLGFKEGNAKRAALIDKVRQWGYKDAKSGAKKQRDAIASLPEIAQLLKDGTPPPYILPSLYENYDDAFDTARAAAAH